MVSWSGKFPIERCYVISGAESQYPPLESLARLCCVVSRVRRDSQLARTVPDSQLARTVPDSTEGFLGRDLLGRARAPLSDGLLDYTHPSVLRAPSVSAPVSFSWIYWLVGCCLYRVWGFPPPVNVVNRAYQMDRLSMPIWSFYSKTTIVILICPSDMFPPVLPTFAALVTN